MRWLATFAALAPLLAQSPAPRAAAPDPGSAPASRAKAIRAQMEAAIRLQQSSVRKQVLSAEGTSQAAAGNEWFSVPWTNEPDGPFFSLSGDALPPVEPLPPPPPGSKDSPNAAPVPAKAAAWSNWPCDPVLPGDIDGPIQRAAQRERVPADLLRVVIEKESAYVPCATSSKGAMGLMQLMPATAAALGVDDPFDPISNLNGGAKYLGQLLNRYGGDLRLALGAYNAGPGQVDQYGGVPPFAETRNYIEKVLGALNLLP